MRVAHVTATFPPYTGGTGNVCYCNARELARRGYDVQVFTAVMDQTTPAAAEEQRDGICIHRFIPLLRLGNAPLLPQLFSALRGFDLIHLHYPFFGGELAAIAARFYHIPLVITYHQDVLLSGPLGWIEKILRFTIGRYTLRSADRLLFTSRDYGQASYILPLLKGRESHIGEQPNGVDPDVFFPGNPPDHLYTRLGLVPTDQVALLVAGLDQAHYFKGVNIFLQALARLAECKAVIVGDGDLRTTYEDMARSLGLADRVFFAGRVIDSDLPDYYRLAQVTVLPSVTMGEAFGLVLVESLACATPVIASRLPGVRTVVEDGQDGYLVEPGNVIDLAEKMNQIFHNSLRSDQMGIRGRARVEEKYSWAKVVDRLEMVYSTLIKSKRNHD
jgi:glycosyltransferase involved in cell wall biosynthesis